MKDAFVARQTENLKQMYQAGEIQKKPEQLRSSEEKQFLTVESSPCRCGNLVYPFVNVPGPYLCAVCGKELQERDQQDVPESKWWGELLRSIRDRTQEKQ